MEVPLLFCTISSKTNEDRKHAYDIAENREQLICEKLWRINLQKHHRLLALSFLVLNALNGSTNSYCDKMSRKACSFLENVILHSYKLMRDDKLDELREQTYPPVCHFSQQSSLHSTDTRAKIFFFIPLNKDVKRTTHT